MLHSLRILPLYCILIFTAHSAKLLVILLHFLAYIFYSYFVLISYLVLFFFFFFQAEDGIRDLIVTGVQTCALPISLLTFHTEWLAFAIGLAALAAIAIAPSGAAVPIPAICVGLFLLTALLVLQIGRASCRGRG